MSYYRKLYSCGELPSRAKLVYIYLYDRCDKEKKAWPSVKTMVGRVLSNKEIDIRQTLVDVLARVLPTLSEKEARDVKNRQRTVSYHLRRLCSVRIRKYE